MAIRDEYPKIALRGMTNMIPALTGYIDKTPRPLIGHLPVSGTYIIGALSGYGLMVACAAGELLAAQIAGCIPPPAIPRHSLPEHLIYLACERSVMKFCSYPKITTIF